MRKVMVGGVVFGVCAILAAGAAQARPGYKAVFAKVYEVKAGSNLDKLSCQLCHMGSDKKIRNVYGQDLAKALGKANVSDDEATAGLKKIEKMLSADKKTKYIDLIKMDKAPGAPAPAPAPK